jgi:tyrosyl-tRNA synthetase
MTPERQFELLACGTEEILPEGALLERLRLAARDGRPLRVKQGFDPTAPDIHLGHTVGLRKLRQFQDLGHQIVLIVGDTTALVGDPSGRNKTRPQLEPETVEDNAKTYLEQFYRVLERDPKPPRLPVEVRRNSEWLGRMNFVDIARLCSHYTVARMLERDDFAKRFESQQPIALHELLYPMMVGYDSLIIKADVELGATEQKFNLLIGRTIQETYGELPQLAMTLPVLPGLDGVQRMSKSIGNYIGVAEPPGEMFGKVMSLPDKLMSMFWKLVTDASDEELREIERELADPKINPMGIKKRLAERIVRMYHDEGAAQRARENFEAQFSRREVPKDLEAFGRSSVAGAAKDSGKPVMLEFVVAAGFAESRSAARRLISQGAVSVDGEKMSDPEAPRDPGVAFVLRAGRKMKRYVP